jgi:hypothetical protein
MTQDVLKKNLFLFSLSGKARIWYSYFGFNYSSWEDLRTTFYIRFFPLQRIIALRTVLLSFKQEEEESLGMAWNRFSSLVETCLVLGLPALVLL